MGGTIRALSDPGWMGVWVGPPKYGKGWQRARAARPAEGGAGPHSTGVWVGPVRVNNLIYVYLLTSPTPTLSNATRGHAI